MRKKRLFFFATPPMDPRNPTWPCTAAHVCERMRLRACGRTRREPEGTRTWWSEEGCLPASLSHLHSALQLPCARVRESTCLCVFVWMCVCQKRGESGFCPAPPKETALFVIFPSSRQREHQPLDLSLSLSLSLSVFVCVSVCVYMRVGGWKGEGRRDERARWGGVFGTSLSSFLALSLPLFLSLSHCRAALTLEAEEEILAAGPLHYRYVLLIYISWSYGSFNSIPHTVACLNLCILNDVHML